MASKCYWCGNYYESGTGHEDSLGHRYCCLKCYEDAQNSEQVKLEYIARELESVRRHEAAKAKREKQLAEEKAKREKALAEEKARKDFEAAERKRKSDPNNWYPQEWIDHLMSHPEDAGKCPWERIKIDRDMWRELLGARPELSHLCPEGEDICREIEHDRLYARQVDAKWGFSAASISWRVICSCIFMVLCTYTWYSDSPGASNLEAWCSIPLCLVVLALILTGYFILPIIPLVAYWAVFEDNHPGEVGLFSCASLIQIASFFFFSCSVWSMRGRLLPTIVFGAGLGWVFSYWPLSIGLCSSTVLAWSYVGLTVVLGVLSCFGVGVAYRWRTTFIMYALLLLAVSGRAYLCGYASEQGLRKILMSINEKTSYVFADCIANLIPSISNDVSRCGYEQAIRYRDGDGVTVAWQKSDTESELKLSSNDNPIGAALGDPNRVWATGGSPSKDGENVDWHVSNHGESAGREVYVGSGAGGGGRATSYLRTKVTGPCKISFAYRIGTYKGDAIVLCDKEELMHFNDVADAKFDWKDASFEIPEGDHVLSFVYIHPGRGFTNHFNGFLISNFKKTPDEAE